jgi:GNAT superfamily N-acetyltransferase
MTWVDILGYVASVLAAASLMMKSVLKLRLVSLAGAVAFSIYGALLGSVPITALNVLIIGINLYFIIQMLTKKTYFKLLEVDRSSSYVRSFLEFYQQDIARYFPNFAYNPDRADIVYLILRDLLPVGLFVAERDSAGREVVRLDYVIPGYRDLKAGHFLYDELEKQLPPRGITMLYSVPGGEEHHAYLRRMGFTPQGGEGRIKLFARELKG